MNDGRASFRLTQPVILAVRTCPVAAPHRAVAKVARAASGGRRAAPTPRPAAQAALVFAAFALVLLFLASGCAHPGPTDPARTGPFFAPTNFRGEPSLGGVRRVVLLPLDGGAVAPAEFAADLDAVFAAALQQSQRFEVVTLSRAECRRRFRADSLSSTSALPHDLLAALKREFAAEAVMFVDLTAFQAYRPLVLGLRAKLATIDGSRLLWTFDHVFTAADPAVANSARHAFLASDHGDVPADLTPAVLQSPSKFASYAAGAMFETLPPTVERLSAAAAGAMADAPSRAH
jgi:hypothetical protein